MAKYENYDYSQGKFIPIHFDKQILPGTFEYSLNYLIDKAGGPVGSDQATAHLLTDCS